MMAMAMAMAAPRPKSPPSSPDPCGRHRLQHAVDTLHREIGFLEGEINSIEGVHAASKCCKEVDEFIVENTDPFITISSKKGNTDQSHHLSKKFRARTCLSYLSWICCCGGGCSSSSSFQHKGPLRCNSSCCSCGTLERLSRCCRPCRLRCGGCGCASPCPCPCPRCSCGCACSCPRCSCTCPASCNAACCCVVPRCCLCL